MDDHICEWTECEAIDTEYYWFECVECNRPAESDEVLRSLNATEVLSAFKAREQVELKYIAEKELVKYADILEGKKE